MRNKVFSSLFLVTFSSAPKIGFLSYNPQTLKRPYQYLGSKLHVRVLPSCARSSCSDIWAGAVEALRSMVIVKCLRPDPLLQSTALFVRTVFQNDLSSDLDLGAMVANEVPATIPLALVSVTGYCATYRVENLMQTVGARSSLVSTGSQEGFILADKAIAAASRQGTCVLLKNIHLEPSWLGQLEKTLQQSSSQLPPLLDHGGQPIHSRQHPPTVSYHHE